MGIARRHAQRSAVCADRHGIAAVAVQLAARIRGQFAGSGDPALTPANCGPGDPAAAPLAYRAARHHPYPHLGRLARRGFGGTGSGPATGAGARSAAEHHLHRGAVVDPAAGFEHRQTGQTRDPGRPPGHA